MLHAIAPNVSRNGVSSNGQLRSYCRVSLLHRFSFFVPFGAVLCFGSFSSNSLSLSLAPHILSGTLLPTLCIPSLPHPFLSPYAMNSPAHPPPLFTAHSFLYYPSTLLYTLQTRSYHPTILLFNFIDYNTSFTPASRPRSSLHFIYCTLSPSLHHPLSAAFTPLFYTTLVRLFLSPLYLSLSLFSSMLQHLFFCPSIIHILLTTASSHHRITFPPVESAKGPSSVPDPPIFSLFLRPPTRPPFYLTRR